jgi:2-polyprenyl-3-methyl-5-hydroxy-6-metoxy-1,4-benzoquinol methylase
MPPESDAYDTVPYPTRAQSPIHPDRLAALGLLYGLDPRPLDRCRILEIGCGDGGNLIPIAAVLPESPCEGIDASSTAIRRGREYAERSGLRNVALRCVRLPDAAAVTGEFDYILCHGVFSWVPEPVREAILRLGCAHLAPNGLVVVSYNALPGGHARRAVREMLRWHVRDLAAAAEQITEARALAQLVEERLVEQGASALALREELAVARHKEDGHFYHDDLAATNDPFYLHEFMARARRHGLRYLADADLTDLIRPALPADLRGLLAALTSDRVEREQYMDFLVARHFRQTILCHATQPAADSPRAERLARCWFSSPAASLTPDKVGEPGGVAVFEKSGGPRLETDFSPGKLALARLTAAWPRRLSFAELEARTSPVVAGASTGPPAPPARASLCAFLLEAITARLVFCHGFCPRTVQVPGSRPLAFPPARVQAGTGEFVVSAFHQILRLEPPAARALLALLDGTRSRAELLQAMTTLASGQLTERAGGWPATADDLEAALKRLGDEGLLVE